MATPILAGIEAMHQEDYKKAYLLFAAASAAAKMHAAQTDALHYRCVAARLDGDLERALEDGLAGAELAPLHADSHFVLGRVHMARGEYASARACFLKAVQLQPDHEAAAKDLKAAKKALKKQRGSWSSDIFAKWPAWFSGGDVDAIEA